MSKALEFLWHFSREIDLLLMTSSKRFVTMDEHAKHSIMVTIVHISYLTLDVSSDLNSVIRLQIIRQM